MWCPEDLGIIIRQGVDFDCLLFYLNSLCSVSVDVLVLFQVKDLSGHDSTQPSLLKEVFVSIAWAIEFIRHPSAWRTMMKWYWVTKENHAFLSVISIGFYLIQKRGEKEKFSMKSGEFDFSSIEKKSTRIMADKQITDVDSESEDEF